MAAIELCRTAALGGSAAISNAEVARDSGMISPAIPI
jgi:hypothetical protein